MSWEHIGTIAARVARAIQATVPRACGENRRGKRDSQRDKEVLLARTTCKIVGIFDERTGVWFGTNSGRAAVVAFRRDAHVDDTADVGESDVEPLAAFDPMHGNVVRLIGDR